MTDNNIMPEEVKTVAVLIAIAKDNETDTDTSLDELERLLETAGGEAVARVVQLRPSPDKRTFIGSGKVKEIAEFIKANQTVNLLIFDDELSPSQIANIEDEVNVRVIDRTMLILDIFALHAVTGEGKLQVEIACLRYTAPRLVGRGKDMSRLGGGIGTRGPGESKLESDRRHLKRRIAALEEQIADMTRARGVKRSARDKSGIKTVAIVGYTNAGKSTLLNYLTGAGILAEDKLFATLDPTTRRLTLPDGNNVLLTDTVGFIDRLPTHLVKAFKSTLEELKYADIIINLTDLSEKDSERIRKRTVTEKLIEELGASHKPAIQLYNKCDCEVDSEFTPADAVKISAKTGEGMDSFLNKLMDIVNDGKKRVKLFFPHSESGAVTGVYKYATVLECNYSDNGTEIYAECDTEALNRYDKYICK